MFHLLALLSVALSGATRGGLDHAAGPGEPPRLELLVESCDRVVRATVAVVHDVRAQRMTRVLELRVEETYWGEPETKVLFVLDDERNAALGNHGAPAVGELAIWFLERDPWFDSKDVDTCTRIAKVAGASGSDVAVLRGAGHLLIERKGESSLVCLPAGCWSLPDALPVVGEHSTEDPHRKWDQVRESDLDRWLRASISELVPSVDVRLLSNGLGNPAITIDRKGHARRWGSGLGDDKQLEIGDEGLRSVLESATRERFFDLPTTLGRSLGPDSGAYLLRIRTERGSRQIRIQGPADPKQDTPAEIEAHARAMRVWESIPLVREWKVTGH